MPWATLAVTPANCTVESLVAVMVQLAFLGVDYSVFCLAQLLPAVVLVVVLGTCKTSKMLVVMTMVVVDLDQLLQMLTSSRAVWVGLVQLLSTWVLQSVGSKE